MRKLAPLRPRSVASWGDHRTRFLLSPLLTQEFFLTLPPQPFLQTHATVTRRSVTVPQRQQPRASARTTTRRSFAALPFKSGCLTCFRRKGGSQLFCLVYRWW